MRNWRNRSGGNQMEQIPLHHVGLAASGAAGGRAIPFPDRPVFQRISEIISKIIRLNALTSPNAPMSLTQTAHKPSSLRRLAAWYRGAVPGHQTSISPFNLSFTVHSGTNSCDRLRNDRLTPARSGSGEPAHSVVARGVLDHARP